MTSCIGGRAWRVGLAVVAPLLLFSTASLAGQEARVPTPASVLGFQVGSDGNLADWTQLTAYYEKLAEASPRVRVDTLGSSTKGRPFVMLVITSRKNQAELDQLHAVQMKLSDPRTVTGVAELDSLLDRGRVVVLITHAIHSTEVGSSQVAARLAYHLASSNDQEVRRILDNVIVLDIPSLNPDGTQWVADWYDRWKGTSYRDAPLPWLYQYYVGHDDNRDWYAFTQDETRLTVEKAHNRWHPQIVEDIHQMGPDGARMFFPPYVEPWEPNVDPGIVAGVNALGSWMAARLTEEGKPGVVTHAIYDAFTPARAYQHYHAGVRILSEAASARLADPDTVAFSDLRPGRGYDSRKRSWNYPWPWKGGRWGLPEIVNYMEAGAMALLDHAAGHRRFWLENAYRVNERAIQGWKDWPAAWAIPAKQENDTGLADLLRILRTGDVEVRRALAPFDADGRTFPAGTYVVPMHQPYASFAQALLEVQHYPDLRVYPGGPPLRPYDATAQTLPLLMDVKAVPVDAEPGVELGDTIHAPEPKFQLPPGLTGDSVPRIALYKSWQEPAAEGWTRWLFDRYGLHYDTLHDADIRAGKLEDRYDVIVLQSQSPASIVDGWSSTRMPKPWAGGIGVEGSRALRDFVRNGGRLVAVDDATDFVIQLFDLGVSNAVERLPPGEFYAPGSILRVVLDPDQALSRGMGPETAAWFWQSSRAFEVTDPTIRVVARYGKGNPLLSGWLLGPEHLAGRPALLEADVGKGSLVLFGFQPNYRGQSVATWPLLFNALTTRSTGTKAGGDP